MHTLSAFVASVLTIIPSNLQHVNTTEALFVTVLPTGVGCLSRLFRLVRELSRVFDVSDFNLKEFVYVGLQGRILVRPAPPSLPVISRITRMLMQSERYQTFGNE
uniref:WGS project CBMG000000000 data, contig CS5907-c000577 n=1 Tax=Fusarium acuminatum CS5907 TaxID=1318461 RepID=A0A096PF72_9HYPO|nr:unnamed protein product [Fusarium acuminatum CS5907]